MIETDAGRRRALAWVARREVFRDYYGRPWLHVAGGTVEMDTEARSLILELEEAGMVVCPDRVEGCRVDRYFDLTPAALEP